MGANPGSIRSSLMTMKSCSVTGNASTADSLTSMAPTPSAALAESIEVNQSLLLGAIFVGGLAGGSIPAAPAEALKVPAAMTPNSNPITINAGARSRRVATRTVVCLHLLVMHPS